MPLTDAQIANVLFNETRSLSGPSIQQARINIAHAIVNGDGASGNRPRTGPTSAHVPASEATVYAQCVQAVRQMRDQQVRSVDPTSGARNFNFRRNASRANFYGLPVATQSGPLDNSYPTVDLPATGIYANTYGN
jgi:hypothetical protein